METLPVKPGVSTPPDTTAVARSPQPAVAAAALASALADAAVPLPPSPVQQAVTTARADAAARQGGLGPLMADLQQALDAPVLPPGLKTAIAAVLARQLPTDRPITAETLKQAVAQSGLFLEAQAARTGAPVMDLKAALLTLQQALVAMQAKPPARLQRPTAPPPTAGGEVVGQKAAAATLTGAEDADSLLGRLSGDVEQALARQTLHQLAALPDAGPPRWMFELPLATPQGAAVAQFAIEPDDARPGDDADGPAWRARFSLDLPALGPVHVNLRMDGARTAVTIWAETAEGLARLRDQGGDLVTELGADVAFRAGAPGGVTATPGRLLDHRS